MSHTLHFLIILILVAVIGSQGQEELQLAVPTELEGNIDNDTTTEYTQHEELTSNRTTIASGRRILAGYISKEGEQVYQVRLEITYPSKVSLCGGSLLSRTRILSAAHCCINCLGVEVILGRNRVSSGTRISNAKFIPHERYDNSMKTNDIAMVIISAVTFNRYIQPIAIPNREELTNDWANSRGIVSGFGRIEGNQQSDVQRYTYVTVLSNGRCKQLVPHFGDYNICTLGPGGACNGDSGGPLAVVSNGRTVLIGIVSYGRVDRSQHLCSVQKAVVYTRVTSYVHWIKALM